MGLHQGFEQGPIRPPSEANSLLLRVTRNCPWNRCTFCSVYRKKHFSLRTVEEVIRDIDAVYDAVDQLQGRGGADMPPSAVVNPQAFWAARHWLEGGMKSIFLQDADSLVMKPKNLIAVLKHLQRRFPNVERITSYARSGTLVRIPDEDLTEMAALGLNRIHIGLETASDRILKLVKKGVTKGVHVQAGLKVKKAGMEVSEYVLTGLGGLDFWQDHSVETADALNQINPDFIRFRTLRLADSVELYESDEGLRWRRAPDLVQAKEIRLLLENLDGITSQVKSDHMFNLFQEIDGVLPADKNRLLSVLDRFIAMSPEDQAHYIVGKRFQYVWRLSDMQLPGRLAQVEAVCRQHGITAENVDEKMHALIQDGMRRGMMM